MATQFLTKHITQCSGTPVHKLTCTHTVHASFLHPTTSSKCAPNCASVNLFTAAEPSLLCPTCYESTVRDEYQEFVECCKKKAKEAGCDIDTYVSELKRDFEYRTVAEEEWMKKAHTWCTVFLGQKNFEKWVKEDYKWKVEMKKMRGCKAVDREFEQEVEVSAALR